MELFRFGWKMTVLKIRYTHEKRSCHEQTTPSSPAEQKAELLRQHVVEKKPVSEVCNEAEIQPSLFFMAKGAIGWSAYGIFDPSRAEP